MMYVVDQREEPLLYRQISNNVLVLETRVC